MKVYCSLEFLKIKKLFKWWMLQNYVMLNFYGALLYYPNILYFIKYCYFSHIFCDQNVVPKWPVLTTFFLLDGKFFISKSVLHQYDPLWYELSIIIKSMLRILHNEITIWIFQQNRNVQLKNLSRAHHFFVDIVSNKKLKYQTYFSNVICKDPNLTSARLKKNH